MKKLSKSVIAALSVLTLAGPASASTLSLIFDANMTNATTEDYTNITTLASSLATALFEDTPTGVRLTLSNLNSDFFQPPKTTPTYVASVMISTDLEGAVAGGVDGPLLAVTAANATGDSAQFTKFESPEDFRDLSGYYYSMEMTFGIPTNTTCTAPCSDTALRQGDTVIADFTGFSVANLTPAWIFGQSTFDPDAVANAGGTTDFGKPLSGPQSTYYAALKVRQLTGITDGISIDLIPTVVIGGHEATTPVPLPAGLPLMFSALTGLGILSRRRKAS